MFQTQFTAVKDRPVPGLDCSKDEVRTKQEMRDECDVNLILSRYQKTGQLPGLVEREAMYGDFAEVPQLLEAYEIVERSETAFLALPAQIRAECDNDPAIFLERVRDPEWARKHELALPPSAPGLVDPEADKAAGQAAGGKAPAAKKSGTPDASQQ